MKNKNYISYFIDLIISKPWAFVVTSVVAVLVISYGSLYLTTNFSYRIWFDPDNKELAVFDAFERKFGSDETAVLVVHSPSGIFDYDSIHLIQQITSEMWEISEVIRVDSLTNFNWVRGEEDDIIVDPFVPDDIELTEALLSQKKKIAQDHPSMPGYLINRDADVSVIYARLKPSFDKSPAYEVIVEDIRQMLKKYEGRGDHQFYITGSPALNHAFKESALSDVSLLVPIVCLVTFVFLIFSFRRASGVAFPFLIILLTVMTTLGATGWEKLQLNNITIAVPQFMIAVAIAVVVHLLVNFFMFFNQGMSKEEALKLSAKKNFRPTLLTALSTSIGFFSIATSPIPPVSDMGIMAGTGTLLSWLLTYTVFVPLLQIVPIKPRLIGKKSKDELLSASPRGYFYARIIQTYRYAIVIGFSIFGAIAIYFTSKVEVNSDPFDYFDKSYPLSVSTDFIEKKLGGAVGLEIVIDSGSKEGAKDPKFLAKVEGFQNWLSEFPFISKTISIVDILKDINMTLHGGSHGTAIRSIASMDTADKPFYKLPETKELVAQQLFMYAMSLPQGMDINDRITIDNQSVRLTAMWTVHESKKALELIDQFTQKALSMGLNAHITGKSPLYQSNNNLIVESFLISISMALVLVAALLIVGLRSLKLGMISMIPNFLPLVIGGGVVYLMKQPLDIGTVIVGSVCLGIAVDDTIHFLANFRKYMSQGDSSLEAVAKIFTSTAPALMTTTIVLVAAFGTFALGTFIPNKNFGIFVSIILTIALAIDLTFLPALLMIVEKKKPKEAI